MADVSEAVPEATPDDPARSKPLSEKSGYYYAHSQVSPEGPKQLVGAQTIYNHKPLDKEQAAKLNRHDSEGESAWNMGGTWEEKDFSKQAEKLLKMELLTISSPKSLVSFTEVSTVDECHCGVIFSRGKKKAFLEVEKVELNWELKEGEEKVKGKVEVTELSATGSEEDVHLKVLHKSGELDGEKKKEIEKDIKACQAAIQAATQAVLAQVTTPPTPPS